MRSDITEKLTVAC